ncbi:hypothetical protein HOY80DRAFT_998610 [Tuber brumale]|nr:hypothetical protein HOY80DRAFT_998610 [Tuber brumale]
MTGNCQESICERSTPTGAFSPRASADTSPSPLVCPVPRCQSVFEGVTSHLDFCRHLKCPDLYGRAGYEKVAWLNLHRGEHERCLAALGPTPIPQSFLQGGAMIEANEADKADVANRAQKGGRGGCAEYLRTRAVC